MAPSPDFHGVFPYLVSPIDEEGRVKHDVLTALVDRLIAAGVHGLTPLGSTGEFPYLTTAQRLEIVDTVVKAARGRVPVVAGVAATTTRERSRSQERWWRSGRMGCLRSWRPISRSRMAASRRISAPLRKPSPAPSCCTRTRSSSAPTSRCRSSAG